MELKDKTALVLNGNIRIGRAAASLLQKNGATVKVIRLAKPEDACEEIKKALGKEAGLDIFINYLPAESKNKGGCESFEACLKEALVIMRRQRFGRIVNVADSPVTGYLDYMYIRNRVIAATKTFGRQMCRENIYVNAVIPCLIENEDYSAAEKKYMDELYLHLPAQRAARMEEIISPVLFLASDRAGYIFGQSVKVDGGLGI